MAGAVIMTLMILLMNIISHFFEPPHSVFLRNQEEIKKGLHSNQKLSERVLASNQKIIELIEKRL